MSLFRRREQLPSLHLSNSVKRVDKPKRLEFVHDATEKSRLRRMLERFFRLIRERKQNNKNQD